MHGKFSGMFVTEMFTIHMCVQASCRHLAPQVPQAQCEHGRQKYKDLYGNAHKKLKGKSTVLKKVSLNRKFFTCIVLLDHSFGLNVFK